MKNKKKRNKIRKLLKLKCSKTSFNMGLIFLIATLILLITGAILAIHFNDLGCGNNLKGLGVSFVFGGLLTGFMAYLFWSSTKWDYYY